MAIYTRLRKYIHDIKQKRMIKYIKEAQHKYLVSTGMTNTEITVIEKHIIIEIY